VTEPGTASLRAQYDEAGEVVRVTVEHADPVIKASVDLLVQMEPNPLISGVLRLDTAGEYEYRFVRMETPDVAIFERVEGT
jgi:predicted secreted protein